MILHRNNCQESEFLDFSLLYFSTPYIESLTGIHDALEGVELQHVAPPQLSEVPVLPWPQVQHPASVVGLLVQHPVAVHHIAGLEVRHAVTIHHVVAVLRQLVHLASKVLPLVDPHAEGASVLWMKKHQGN